MSPPGQQAPARNRSNGDDIGTHPIQLAVFGIGIFVGRPHRQRRDEAVFYGPKIKAGN